MHDLKLIAVGSSPLIAEEIKSIAQAFLGENIPIHTATTDEIETGKWNCFYVCAITQAEKLKHVVPEDKLFVFDLHPTTKFFLDIARIPEGSHVYVFNNLLPYTKLLAEECRALGVDKISFHSVAYDEMSNMDVCERLKKARYIIGVDRLVESVLKETYRQCLRSDVQIIEGKRAASVASASKLLAGIAQFYHDELAAEKNPHMGERIIQILKSASAKAIIGQIGGQKPIESETSISDNNIDEQLSVLKYLQEKFLQMTT